MFVFKRIFNLLKGFLYILKDTAKDIHIIRGIDLKSKDFEFDLAEFFFFLKYIILPLLVIWNLSFTVFVYYKAGPITFLYIYFCKYNFFNLFLKFVLLTSTTLYFLKKNVEKNFFLFKFLYKFFFKLQVRSTIKISFTKLSYIFKKLKNMLLIQAVKFLVLGGCMLPIAFGALGTGLLFACYNLAVSRNPDEIDNLFNATLMGFALMETFVFLSFIVGYLIYSL